MAFHIALIRWSRGTLGTHLGHLTFLLLHSVGRKTGRPHVTPISYFSADGIYFLVGSNWGRKRNASWYYNLLDHPHTVIEVNGRRIAVIAYPAEGTEYNNLWNIASGHYRPYLNYKATTPRRIPIIILKPINKDRQ
jgi:deazaflavin-dependent oxidoreductase (nitroreductase family)